MRGDISGDAIGGTMLGTDARPVRAYAAGRICDEPGCHVVLSIYNSETRCALHRRIDVSPLVVRPAHYRKARSNVLPFDRPMADDAQAAA